MNEDDAKIANKLFNEAHSNLDTPVVGCIYFPICKSCQNADYHYGTWDDPECKVYGKMPFEFKMGKRKNCPHYIKDPNSKWRVFTEEDVKNR